ncbi:hypothetical protein PG993_010882 [Apiospora rasikravindrae]|uniref:BTB domain-containing protein n=1 Tax=Apiospora rasikravindrae TaxID=990691 RepID=A0ABR1SCK3_9PEZI
MPSSHNSGIGTKGDKLLWQTRIYADMKIICDGKYWLVHRNILASRCDWFNARISGLCKKGEYYELKLEGYHHRLVRSFLYFIYNGVIDHEHLKDTSKPDNVVLAKLHRMASDFDLWKLKDALVAMCTHYLDGQIEYYAQSPKENLQVTGILAGVKYAYSRAEHQQADLRAVYVNFFARCHRNVINNPHFYEQIRAIPDFSADLLKVTGKTGWGGESDGEESESDRRARRHTRKKHGKKHKHRSQSRK